MRKSMLVQLGSAMEELGIPAKSSPEKTAFSVGIEQ